MSCLIVLSKLKNYTRRNEILFNLEMFRENRQFACNLSFLRTILHFIITSTLKVFPYSIVICILLLDKFFLCFIIFCIISFRKELPMNRILALILLLIPGFLAALGVKLMRDMVFGILQRPIPFLWLQFLIGLFLFLIGLWFIGGFILHRDRKRNKVQSRFQGENTKEKDVK